MNLVEKIKEIDKNFYSRINTYIFIKDIGEKIGDIPNEYTVIDFEKIAEDFFIKTNSSLTIFDIVNFFIYLQTVLYVD